MQTGGVSCEHVTYNGAERVHKTVRLNTLLPAPFYCFVTTSTRLWTTFNPSAAGYPRIIIHRISGHNLHKICLQRILEVSGE